MKHLKQYEDVNKVPEIDDYVYCETDEDADYTPANFIGILTNIIPDRKQYPYRVKYSDKDDTDRLIRKNEVKDFAKTYDELEHYVSGTKYNI